MIRWKTGLVLLVVLAGLAAYLLLSQRKAAPEPAALIPCDPVATVWVEIATSARTLEVQRADPRADWQVLQPVGAAADHDVVESLVSAIDSIAVQNTLSTPADASTTGLDQPREVVSCRVAAGASYNLTVGKQSFDGSGYYARKGGDNRVYVISGVEVDIFDQALIRPPVKPSPNS